MHLRCSICSSSGEGTGLCLDCAEREAQEAEDRQSRPLQLQNLGGVSPGMSDVMGPVHIPPANDPIDLEPPNSQPILHMGDDGGLQGREEHIHASEHSGPSPQGSQGAAWRGSIQEPAIAQRNPVGEGPVGGRAGLGRGAGSEDLKEGGTRKRRRAEVQREVPSECGEDRRQWGNAVAVGRREEGRPTDTQECDGLAGRHASACPLSINAGIVLCVPALYRILCRLKIN